MRRPRGREEARPRGRNFLASLRTCLLAVLFCASAASADKVITKDGKTYTGKILIDTDKAVLIGNPPYDPNSTMIQAEDIQTIVYEEYHQAPPAIRKRGWAFDFHLAGTFSSSDELSLGPAPSLRLGVGLRPHPLIEFGGGLEWTPGVAASGDGLNISNGTTARGYSRFWSYNPDFIAKIYPVFFKKWKYEPYLITGFAWSTLVPKGTSDSITGSGWMLGAGMMQPLTRNLFIDERFIYRPIRYKSVTFLGQEAGITPEIKEDQFLLALGLSYRL
jgi:hypothetical protein